MTSALLDRYDDRIAGVLSCYDRVVMTGTLPTVCYAAGITQLLYAREVGGIFDYPQFAATLRDRVRERAAWLAAQAGISIEHIAKSHIRKETVVAKVLEPRGNNPGLVHVISAMEACDAYQPWHDKQTHKTYVRPDTGKCLHYYFYFLDDELGLIYRQAAASRFISACSSTATATAGWRGDWRRKASASPPPTMPLSASITGRAPRKSIIALSPDRLHRVLDHYAALCCPVLDVFAQVHRCRLIVSWEMTKRTC